MSSPINIHPATFKSDFLGRVGQLTDTQSELLKTDAKEVDAISSAIEAVRADIEANYNKLTAMDATLADENAASFDDVDALFKDMQGDISHDLSGNSSPLSKMVKVGETLGPFHNQMPASMPTSQQTAYSTAFAAFDSASYALNHTMSDIGTTQADAQASGQPSDGPAVRALMTTLAEQAQTLSSAAKSLSTFIDGCDFSGVDDDTVDDLKSAGETLGDAASKLEDLIPDITAMGTPLAGAGALTPAGQLLLKKIREDQDEENTDIELSQQAVLKGTSDRDLWSMVMNALGNILTKWLATAKDVAHNL